MTALVVLLLTVLWCAAFFAAVLADLHRIGHWQGLPLRVRTWRSIKDTGDPMRYVHMFYGECRRSWCYCQKVPPGEAE